MLPREQSYDKLQQGQARLELPRAVLLVIVDVLGLVLGNGRRVLA